ncbi:MAG TPA: hypothetical protein VFA83_00260 [Acidimicrobiales bacterium]|nr:hypothetical protein [Acidimicrobiales bacterium]
MFRRLAAATLLTTALGLTAQVGTASADIFSRRGFNKCVAAANAQFRARVHQTDVPIAIARADRSNQIRHCRERFL